MSDPSLDERGRRLAETLQAELAKRGLGDKMTARYDPDVECVLVGPVVLDVERRHEVYYPVGLEYADIVKDLVRRAGDEPHEP
jgi:hypothetical protein